MWTLPIFPEDTLAAAVTTTVCIGVWVVVMFNLRLGWPLSGLVVPGYLVPLMLAKPVSAVVIVGEAVITYAVVWLLSEQLKPIRGWSALFGRDRFFALVVVSVLVRAVMDGFFLPWLGPQINSFAGIDLDYRNHLHSYGLIVVSLIANYFWKPGLLRGAFPLTVTVGITFLIVRFVLIEFTNFNLGSLQYMYEDISASLLASPKAYIILITTALIASWMNLRFGWDFNGILVPALLALQWYAPHRILASFVEAGVVYFLARAVLRLPLLQRTTMEGGRRTLLFFTIAYVYRLTLGHVAPIVLPEIKVTDLYGFGYLLSTLIALKADQKSAGLRLTWASVQVSLLGAVGGSAAGFALTFLPTTWLMSAAPHNKVVDVAYRPADNLVVQLRRDKVLLYEKRQPNSFDRPLAADLDWFKNGLQQLARYMRNPLPGQLAVARDSLAKANYQVHLIDDRYLYLREHAPRHGWGLFIVDMHHLDGPVIEVPAPLDESGMVEAGLTLMQQLEGGALAIAGTSRRVNDDGSADVLVNVRTAYGVFHQVFARGNVLEVRGYTRSSLRQLAGIGRRQSTAAAEGLDNTLWIKRQVPHGIHLRKLNSLVGDFAVRWGSAPTVNGIRDGSWSGFGQLWLNRRAKRRLHGRAIQSGELNEPLREHHGSLAQYLLDMKPLIAPAGSGLYRPPRREEMIMMDSEVLLPMLATAQRVSRATELTQSDREELSVASLTAAALGYRLTLFHDHGSGFEYLILEPISPDGAPAWGWFGVQLGIHRPHLVEVPRPIRERFTVEYGAALIERVQAGAWLLAGAHPEANADGSADVVRIGNPISLFNMFHQACLREAKSRPMLVTQVRAISNPVSVDVVIGTPDGRHRESDLSAYKREITHLLRDDGLKVKLVDGSVETAGYEPTSTLQLIGLNQFENKQWMSVWLAPELRSRYRQQSHQRTEVSKLELIGIEPIHQSLFGYLSGIRSHDIYQPDAKVRRLVEHYLNSRDVMVLRELQGLHVRIHWIIDPTSRQSLLAFTQHKGQLPAVVKLADPLGAGPPTSWTGPLQKSSIREFMHSKAAWLQLRNER